MNVALAAVISEDNFLTAGKKPGNTWASAEDAANYRRLLKDYPCRVMGRTTYLAAKPGMKHAPGTLSIVLTNQPDQFAAEANQQLLFAAANPAEVLTIAQQHGFDRLLVVGGSYVYADFQAAGLVSDYFITIEPVMLGSGAPLFHGLTFDISQFEVIDQKPLNEIGTTLFHLRRS